MEIVLIVALPLPHTLSPEKKKAEFLADRQPFTIWLIPFFVFCLFSFSKSEQNNQRKKSKYVQIYFQKEENKFMSSETKTNISSHTLSFSLLAIKLLAHICTNRQLINIVSISGSLHCFLCI